MSVNVPPQRRARERMIRLGGVVRVVQMRPGTALEIELAATGDIPRDATFYLSECETMAVLWDDPSDADSGYSIITYDALHGVMGVLRPPQRADGTGDTP